MKYYIDTTMQASFEIAVHAVKSALPEIGFGIVTEFDIDEKFKEKLGIDFRKYKVIGACNPKFAHEAIQIEPLLGTLLPCNIVIQEIAQNQTKVAAVDPVVSMMAIENPMLKETTKEIKALLQKLIENLK